MTEWTKKRKCESCGKIFTLKDHGHSGARAAAKALEQDPDKFDSRADYFAVRECPVCAKRTKTNVIKKAIVHAKRKGTIFEDPGAFGYICGMVIAGFVIYQSLNYEPIILAGRAGIIASIIVGIIAGIATYKATRRFGVLIGMFFGGFVGAILWLIALFLLGIGWN